ncbi:MAG: glycosyltransferase [Euryarchaeota archaeon]|nr:glycosyltransferase [Euryarchaeota archaeon]
MIHPRVSVIIPTLNSSHHLEESLRSIINQSFRDLEIIIIDDGSDYIKDIIQGIADPRIHYIRNNDRLGLVKSLNLGITLSNGEFIVRMDADDIAEVNRLEKQVELLDRCSNIGAVGSAIRLIDDMGRDIGTRYYPRTPARTRWFAHFNAPIAHPSVMFRKSIIEHIGLYSETFSHCEDYELWLRMLEVTDIVNIAQPLLRYRIHDESVSSIQDTTQAEISLDLSCRTISKTINQHVDRDAVNGIKHPYSVMSRDQLTSSILLLHKLAEAYLQEVSLDRHEKNAICRDVTMLTSHLIVRSFRLGAFATISAIKDAIYCKPSSITYLTTELIARIGEQWSGNEQGFMRS